MAQTQVLSQRLSDDNLSFLRASHSQPPLRANCSFNTSVSFQSLDNTIADYTMTQPMLYSQYVPDMATQAQRWSAQRDPAPKYEMDVAATIDNASDGLIPPQGRFYNALGWNHVMMADQYSVSGSDNAFRQNQDLGYNSMAAQSMADKNLGGYLGLQSWASSGASQGPHGVQMNGSDVDTRSSLSPKRYFSDQPGSETTSYSPGEMTDRTSPLDTHNRYSTSFQSIKESPSMGASSRYRLAMRNAQGSTVSNCASVPRMDPSFMASRMPSAKSEFYNGMQTMSYQDARQCGPEFSALQGDNTSPSSWHFQGYANDLSGLPLHSPQVQDNSTFPNPFSSHKHGHTQEERAVLDQSRTATRAQDRHLDRSQALPIVDTDAQRKVNDEILIQGKKDGMTYKDIRRKLVGKKPAESTLRGRYRALTKERKDRVRKPVWTRKDIQLLNEFVEQEFDRIESTLPSSNSLSLDQKLVKVAWKKVADYIDNQGGSYHFGNSTCKRKWVEVNERALK